MNSIKECVQNYLEKVNDKMDKKILNQVLTMIEYKTMFTDTELDNFNFIFSMLKQDYTLSFSQNLNNSEYEIIMEKQNTPLYQCTHNISVIRNELKRLVSNELIDKTTENVICFLEASEHIEENELSSIETIMDFINRDWIMGKFENTDTRHYASFSPYRTQKLKKISMNN